MNMQIRPGLSKVLAGLILFASVQVMSGWAQVVAAAAEGGVAANNGTEVPRTMPTSREMLRMAEWSASHLRKSARDVPFSFAFDNRPSTAWLGSWTLATERRVLDDTRTEYRNSWTDPATGLQVRAVAVEYSDFPVVEWTVYLKNTGTKATPILENVLGLDTTFERGDSGEFILRGLKGDFCTADSYEPFQYDLGPGLAKTFGPPDYSGKSCDGPNGWPFYNLQMPTGGVILAVGWPGQWKSTFTRNTGTRARVQAGQGETHLVLEPSEEIRTPLMALLFWDGSDWVRSQNLWRRWYLAHVLPRIQGQPQPPVLQIQVDGSMQKSGDVQAFLDAGIQPDICWRDAGGGHTWYPSATGPYQGNDGWLNTGTWEVDSTKYPDGFRPFSDWARARRMQFLLWFEPERVGDTNCWLATAHPDWMLPGSSHGAILNLGHPGAFHWLVDHVDAMIKTQGLDWYREDMNGGGPLPAWRRHDAPNRRGLTENLYVQGHLAFWDELRRRNPGLHIDSCASGGRRNDLESMRRAVPLLRSDFQFPDMKGVVEGNQGHTFGLSFWLPFQGTGCYLYDTYALRSFYLAGFGTGGLDPATIPAQKRAYTECREVAPLMLGDYYPLTKYSREVDRWIAWQFNRPEQSDGLVQAFRRGASAVSQAKLVLFGLDPKAKFEIKNFDGAARPVFLGKELMETGLSVDIPDKPGAALIRYRKIE